jgi:hypothetical protein
MHRAVKLIKISLSVTGALKTINFNNSARHDINTRAAQCNELVSRAAMLLASCRKK